MVIIERLQCKGRVLKRGLAIEAVYSLLSLIVLLLLQLGHYRLTR